LPKFGAGGSCVNLNPPAGTEISKTPFRDFLRHHEDACLPVCSGATSEVTADAIESLAAPVCLPLSRHGYV
jgi:hypothetical protein